MLSEELKSALRGIQVILVTPLTPRLEVDLDGLAANVEVLLNLGAGGFLVSGTYGEFPTLTSAERLGLFRTVCGVVKGRVPVITCVAHSSTDEVLRLSEVAIDAGASALMLTPPFVSEVDESAIIEHFATVARRFPVGLVIYNNPRLGVALTPTGLGRIVDEVEGISGLKQGATDVRELEETVERVGSRIAVLCGSDTMVTTGLGLGMPGCTSTNAGAFPELIFGIWRAFRQDAWAEARRLHAMWKPFRVFAARTGQPATVKAAIDLRGWRGGPVRPPLRTLTSVERKQLRPIVEGLADPQPAAPASR